MRGPRFEQTIMELQVRRTLFFLCQAVTLGPSLVLQCSVGHLNGGRMYFGKNRAHVQIMGGRKHARLWKP